MSTEATERRKNEARDDYNPFADIEEARWCKSEERDDDDPYAAFEEAMWYWYCERLKKGRAGDQAEKALADAYEELRNFQRDLDERDIDMQLGAIYDQLQGHETDKGEPCGCSHARALVEAVEELCNIKRRLAEQCDLVSLLQSREAVDLKDARCRFRGFMGW